MTCVTGILCENSGKLSQAQRLSKTLNLPLVKHSQGWVLALTDDAMSLIHPKHQPLLVDFSQKTLQNRAQHIAKEALIKACSQSPGSYVIDTTAGWGIDSFLLASFGYQVLMFEQSNIMSLLLQDGLSRYKQIAPNFPLSLEPINAIDYLSILEHQKPEVIYLDPMFPQTKGKRLSKLSMTILAQLSPTNELASDKLFDLALQKALKRVIVKRYGKHDYLLGKKPTFSQYGRSHRFDVYCIG